ncbi:MAG: hypothetical protein GY847_22380 [Proteobacteria bacterium]|nr:hypothetical protein [Pseudomonadota bacterium]
MGSKPLPSDVHVNKPLTNVAMRYLQDEKEFIAGKVFPEVPVMKQSDVYYKFDKADWFRTETGPRPLASETAGATFGVSTDNYYCKVEGLHSDIDDRLRANADSIFKLDKIHTELVTRKNLLRREIQFGSTYFTTGVWTGSSTGTDIVPTTLFDVSGSSPLEVIGDEMDAMEEKTGFRPNKLTTGRDVWTKLKNHAEIIGRLGDAKDKFATQRFVAALLGLDEVLVSGVTNNTAVEGAADVMAYMYKKNMLLTYSPKAASIELPSAGYTFNWTNYLGANASGHRISKFRMEPIKSDRIEGEMAYDQKLTGADLGVFFHGVIS